VVCLTLAWTVGEVLGVHHSLEHQPLQAPWFYGSLALILAAGGSLVASGVNLISLSVAAGVVNALLLPLCSAVSIASRASPRRNRCVCKAPTQFLWRWPL